MIEQKSRERNNMKRKEKEKGTEVLGQFRTVS